MTKVKFEDIRQRLIDKLKTTNLEVREKFAIIENYVQIPVKTEDTALTGLICEYIPAIGIVGEETGKIHLFAVTRLLPDLDI